MILVPLSICAVSEFFLIREKLSIWGTPKEVSEHYLATLCEAKQQIDGITSTGTDSNSDQPTTIDEYRDIRESILIKSNLRNDIELFRFEPNGNSFGLGRAQIISIRLLDKNFTPLSWVIGGEDVILEICVLAKEDILSQLLVSNFEIDLDRLFLRTIHFLFISLIL
jgi:lipopolysaccharide transport system ATP-binding protein